LKNEFKTDEVTIKKDENLINYLNQYEDFQIVNAEGSHVYYNGQFCKCNIPFDKEPLEPIVEEYKLIGEKRIENEKGDYSVVRDEWSEESLFYLISSQGIDLEEEQELKKELSKMDYIVCTDLGVEIADFIGVSEDTKKVY